MKYFFVALLVSLFCLNGLHSQHNVSIKKSIDIPFEYVNNFIIIDVVFNNKIPLKFIFDTGAEHTILTKSEYSFISGIVLGREFKILGADLTTEITANLARRVSFKISRIFIPTIDILVFKEDYFQFEEMTGVEVDGIMGANIFSHYVLEINYKRKIITLHNPISFKTPGEKFSEIPITIIRNKPYVVAKARIDEVSPTIDLKLLLDTGASLSLLLYTDTHKSITIPPNVIKGNIGLGLGGFLEGYLGRSREIKIADFQLNNVITNFQDIHELIDTSLLFGRNGIIGNLILDRFNVIIDYRKELLYLKPNKKFKTVFKYDRSGLVLIASGKHLDTIVVSSVVPGSPADEAGLKKGDIIKKVGWVPAGYISMKDFIQIFQKRVGKKIKLTIRRNGERMKFEFRLRDLI